MDPVSIVTDSTSDLAPNVATAHNIEVVPLSVIHADRAYLDGVDITPSSFYPMLTSSSELPKTSQPTVHQFKEVFGRLLQQGHSVVSLHISGGLSATKDAARSAAAELETDRVTVIDSGFLSYGLSFQAIEASKMAQQGCSVEEIVAMLDEMRRNTELLFTLDTMHYLHKGGRIGKVSALLGNLLNIKPVIRVEGGIYVPVAKCRSSRQALATIVQYLTDRFSQQKVRLAVGHGQAEEAARSLLEMLKQELCVEGEPEFYEVGPVIGVHTGPGTVGAAVCPVI